MKAKTNFLLPYLAFTTLVACNAELPEPKSASAIASNSTDAVGGNAVARDPSRAALKIIDFSKVPASAGSSIFVPGISVNFSNADYYQLLRCKHTTALSTSTGVNARQYFTSLKSHELKDVWRRAEGECAYVGKKIAREKFEDLTAGHTTVEQHFYYVLNPCVNDSAEKNETCSYQLAFTESTKYTSQFAIDFINLGAKLNELEGSLTSLFYQLSSITTQTRFAIEKCEDDHFKQKLEEKKKAGLFGILKVGVSALVGGLVAGPAAAFIQTSGVLDGVMSYFEPRPNDQPFSCPAAERFKPMAKQLAEKDIPEAIMQVKTVRGKMNSVNQSYAKLDIQTLKENN